MPARPCHIALTGCPGVDSPITNISAEAPDPLLFWGVPWNPYNPYKPPPLGNGQYVIEDCPGWFTSLIAQFDPVVYAQTQLWANLQALALQLGCDIPQVGDLTFQNDAQTATVHCPDGSAFSYTVDAGTITATFADPELGAAWVLAANAWALAYAFEQASALLQCGVGDPEIPRIPGDNPPDFPRGPGILENPSWMCFGENYVDNYTITGGSIITNYTMSVIAGAIPPGTVFTQTGPRSANVSGVVTAPGQYTWTIQAVSTSIPTLTVTFQDSLWVMGITNADSLPDAELGIPYLETLSGIGGTSPYTFALDPSSDLPLGLSLSSNGTIVGIPSESGFFNFTVKITDIRGGECDQDCLLTVVETCVADTACPTLTRFSYLCTVPNSVYVTDWNALKSQLIAPTADPAGVQPEWDGTLPILDQVTFPNVDEWIPTGSVPPVYATFALNGLKGTLIILERTGGISPWLLFLRGSVGGVNTVIWQGTRTVGSSPIGTYMRTGGLSAGPACFHVSGPTTPVALAWWAMEGPDPLDNVDSACSLHLVQTTGAAGDYSIVAGHLLNGVQISCGSTVPISTTDDLLRCSNAGLKFNGIGVTIFGWVNITDTVPNGLNDVIVDYLFDQNGISYEIRVERQGVNGNNWVASINGLGSISIASAAGWHFLVITFDAVSGNLGFDIDQSGMTTSFTVIPSIGSNINGVFLLSTHTEAGKVVTVIFDEFAMYDGVLTSTQLDCLYNAGVGKRY